MSKSMCIVPWVGFSNDPDGTVRACCISKERVTKENGDLYYTQLDNVKDIFHSPYMKQLRQDFIDGKKPKSVKYVGRMRKMVTRVNVNIIMKL